MHCPRFWRATRLEDVPPTPDSPPPANRDADWSRVKLHVVTGKGGTGKSTVAAALALALASSGRRVLLCEVEGRQGIARMFDVDPLPYAETKVARGLADADGRAGTVHALHIDPESALLEYLAMYYKLGRAGKALDKFGITEFATTVAPGVRDVLLTGKVFEAVERNARNKGALTYDAVVLDAPPTGRIAQFLNVNGELAGLAKVGPIRGQADRVMTLFQSPRTAIHLVTLLEEMPVTETIDGIAELRSVDLPVGAVVTNLVRPHELDEATLAAAASGTLDRDEVAAGLLAADLTPDDVLVDELLDQAADHATRIELEQQQREVVAGAGVPTYALPQLPGGVDLGGLYELAAILKDGGLGR